MITIKNVKTLDGRTTDIQLSSLKEKTVEADHRLLLLPALIDPHMKSCFSNEENWNFTIEAAVKGGIGTIVDIPSQAFPCEDKQDVEKKKQEVDKRLADSKIPLQVLYYGKGNSKRAQEAGEGRLISGSLILLTPEEHILDEESWERIFQLAAWNDLPVVINSMNENSRIKSLQGTLFEKSFYYAEKQNARLYILNVGTEHEISLIEDARRKSLLVYAETTPQYLFPLSGQKADFLWEALSNGVIETIGSGFQADSQNQDKLVFSNNNYDFLNPHFLLPMLLTAYHEGKISLENIVRSTRVNFYELFKINRKDENYVLVDLDKEQMTQRIFPGGTVGIKMKGWPVYTILKGNIFATSENSHSLSRIE